MDPTLAKRSQVSAAVRRRRALVSITAVGFLTVVGGLLLFASGGSAHHSHPVARSMSPATADSLPDLPAAGAALGANIYAADGVNMFSPAVQGALYRLYVPNSQANTVDVIDPTTFRVVDQFKVGRLPQHIVPAWDLKTLYVTNDQSNTLTPIDPKTGKRGGPDIAVDDPYNMYFTPDGSEAIVVAEAHHHLDFRDAHTFALKHRVPVKCAGVDHIDFAADNSYLIASCEFSGQLVKVDLRTESVVGYLDIGGKPQDVKLDPAGKVFYVADMVGNGLDEIDGASFTKIGFLATGPETHGLYPSRDAKTMYVANRGGMKTNHGSISVVDFTTRRVVATWPIPPPSTPDMGGVSPDGKTLWLAGRRTNEVYGIDTTTGKLTARIHVGAGPHGLCVWPQPGRYSLGHTGILR
jgi:YVTN family beta-propeller protein